MTPTTLLVKEIMLRNKGVEITVPYSMAYLKEAFLRHVDSLENGRKQLEDKRFRKHLSALCVKPYA